ncbi:MAG TPA: hypothetical protein VEL51_02375 [Vicinamibacterales bacterium]|nr:hypothetical protein [Vicinamibacterales bacterium]
MEIRFISSLTPEDENVFAPAVLKAVVALLDQFPIAYTLRIETAGTHVYQHSHPSIGDPAMPLRADFPPKPRLLSTSQD